jgi:RNA-directed DNA polymerase
MLKKPTKRALRRRAEAFRACSTLEELARLLGVSAAKLAALAANPVYREFTVPKKDGSPRYIEDPVLLLKRVQDYLADFLQAVYYEHRTPAAYGFMIRPVDDPEPRHILSNAQAHLGQPWLLNLDLEDFFHFIPTQRVREVLAAPIIGFPADLCEILADLCTYKSRLPMGAPTSPVLSNLATIPLDEELLHLAETKNWLYTRYADDMSFSSHEPITEEHVSQIEYYVKLWGHELNPLKKKLYKPGQNDKEVTGLIVSGDKVALPDDYLPNLESVIVHLAKVIEAQHYVPAGRAQTSSWVEDLRTGIHGKLEFARHILGADHHWVSRLTGRYYDAIRPPEDYGAISWLEFGYDWDMRSHW